MENSNPVVRQKSAKHAELEFSDGRLCVVSAEAVFELIRNIQDPEHPYTLEQLGIVSVEDIAVGAIADAGADGGVLCRTGLPIKHITVVFTPTVPHCSLAGIIGLCIIHQLRRHVGGHWIRVCIKDDTHTNYLALNKQLNDSDRVMAALENESLFDILESCINGS